MITAAVVFVFGIAAIACAFSGEWGAFAVGAAIVVFVILLKVLDTETCRAWNNWESYWANGGRSRAERKRAAEARASLRRIEREKRETEKAFREALEREKKEGYEQLPLREHSAFESETLKARYAPMERSQAYKDALARKQANG